MAGVRSECFAKGLVTVLERGSHDGNTRVVFREESNTVLHVGREALLRQLINSYTGAHFSYMLFGDGGATEDGGVRTPISVAQDRTALFGSELDRVPVVGSFSYSTAGLPYLIVSGMLGAESPANGSWISETALMLASGSLYAMKTWAGVLKNAEVDLVVNWQVFFL